MKKIFLLCLLFFQTICMFADSEPAISEIPPHNQFMDNLTCTFGISVIFLCYLFYSIKRFLRNANLPQAKWVFALPIWYYFIFHSILISIVPLGEVMAQMFVEKNLSFVYGVFYLFNIAVFFISSWIIFRIFKNSIKPIDFTHRLTIILTCAYSFYIIYMYIQLGSKDFELGLAFMGKSTTNSKILLFANLILLWFLQIKFLNATKDLMQDKSKAIDIISMIRTKSNISQGGSTQSNTKDDTQTKVCPYCGETILAVAKKCKHCGEWLEENASEIGSKEQQQSIDNKDSSDSD